jgi:integrase
MMFLVLRNKSMELSLRKTTYIDWKVYSITNIKSKYGYRVKLIYGENDYDIHQKSGFKTKNEAEKSRNETIAMLSNRTYVVYRSIMVSEFYNYWLEKVMRPRITNSSYYSYRNAINNYIIKEIGQIQVDKINQGHIRRLYNNVAKRSIAVLRIIKTIMNTSLNYAKKRNIVSVNVAISVDLPKQVEKKEYRKVNIDSSKTLTIEQLKELIKASETTPIHLQILFASLMGLRISEINGLKYSDIDYINKKIYIGRQLGKDKNKSELNCRKKTITKQEIRVKTKSSNRWVDIPDVIFNKILDERKKYEINRKRRINDKSFPFRDDDYICCSTYGNSRSKGFYYKYYKRIFADNNIPYVTFHHLRSTYTTLLLKANFSSKAVSELLGHSSEIITVDVYTDKSKLIYDCLDKIEPYINDVIPNLNQTRKNNDYSDFEINIDNYLN